MQKNEAVGNLTRVHPISEENLGRNGQKERGIRVRRVGSANRSYEPETGAELRKRSSRRFNEKLFAGRIERPTEGICIEASGLSRTAESSNEKSIREGRYGFATDQPPSVRPKEVMIRFKLIKGDVKAEN